MKQYIGISRDHSISMRPIAKHYDEFFQSTLMDNFYEMPAYMADNDDTYESLD